MLLNKGFISRSWGVSLSELFKGSYRGALWKEREGGGGQRYERPPLSPCFSNTTPALWYLDLDLVENEAKVHSMTALKTETEM